MRLRRAVIRLPGEVVDQLDQVVARLRAAAPERSVSRAALARVLIAGELVALGQDPSKFERVAQLVLPPRTRRRRSP